MNVLSFDTHSSISLTPSPPSTQWRQRRYTSTWSERFIIIFYAGCWWVLQCKGQRERQRENNGEKQMHKQIKTIKDWDHAEGKIEGRKKKYERQKTLLPILLPLVWMVPGVIRKTSEERGRDGSRSIEFTFESKRKRSSGFIMVIVMKMMVIISIMIIMIMHIIIIISLYKTKCAVCVYVLDVYMDVCILACLYVYLQML